MRIMYKALLAVKNIITMRKTISILLNYINHEMNFKKHIRRRYLRLCFEYDKKRA